jgi:hypothetical protein
MAEALVVTIAIVAVVAFVRSTSGPPHPVALSHAASSPSTSVGTTTTTAPPAPSIDAQVSAWWSSTGESATAALSADLEAVQQGGTGTTSPSASCAALSQDTASAASAPPAPSPGIEREWQLTVSTSTRASAACEAGRRTSLAGDLQPALYTIHDLSDQVKPYLAG